ncbi:MAG: O-antigen ligase family protein [Trueperaceae bacterium]
MAALYKGATQYVSFAPVTRFKIWLGLWLPFLLLSVLPVIFARRAVDVDNIFLIATIALIFSLLQVRQQLFYRLLFISLILLVLVGTMVQLIAPHLWMNTNRTSIGAFLSNIYEDHIEEIGSRAWHVSPTVSQLELSFEAKLVSGELGWQWVGSEPGIHLETLIEEGTTFTRVTTPSGGDPYLMRTFDLNRVVGGHQVRVDITMRSAPSLPLLDCRGIWLQTWGEGAEINCLAVALTPMWQTFRHTWTIPDTATSDIVRVVLNDFDGQTYDVATMKFYIREGEQWLELAPLLPAAPALTSSWDTGEVNSGQGFIPTQSWQSYTFPILKRTVIQSETTNQSKAEPLNVFLTIPPGVTLATRGVRLNVPSNVDINIVRQSYIFGHPNIAGHTVVVFALLALVLSLKFRSQILIAGLGLVSCFFTGSRSAWIVLLLGLGILSWLKQPSRRKVLITLYVLSILTLVATWQYLGRLQITAVDNTWSRLDIWVTSLKIVGDHLLLGIGTSHQRFADLWFAYNKTAILPVVHAHNLLLEWLVNFGILGGLAIVWLFAGFFRLAWLRQKWLGMCIVLAVLALNMADVSLFYAWVMVPLILYLNSSE